VGQARTADRDLDRIAVGLQHGEWVGNSINKISKRVRKEWERGREREGEEERRRRRGGEGEKMEKRVEGLRGIKKEREHVPGDGKAFS
jgi:hypothetical protein